MRPSDASSKSQNDQQVCEQINNSNVKKTVSRRQLKQSKAINGGRKFSVVDQAQKNDATASVKSFERNMSIYQKIDEANEEEENERDEREKKKVNRMSRFKAIASLIIKNKNSEKLTNSE